LKRALHVRRGEWTLMSIAVDSEHGRVAVYMNGQLLGEQSVPNSKVLRPDGPYVIRTLPPDDEQNDDDDADDADEQDKQKNDADDDNDVEDKTMSDEVNVTAAAAAQRAANEHGIYLFGHARSHCPVATVVR
jgi:hypothetical protein